MMHSRVGFRAFAAALLFAAPAAFAQAIPFIEDIAGTAISSRPGQEFPLVPFGMAIAPDGRVYINDTGSSPDRIRRLDPATGLVNTVPGTPGSSDLLMDARSIAFHPLTGEAHVATATAIFRVNFSTGTRVQVSGSFGSSLGQIAFDSLGNLYVPDRASHRVRVLRTTGVVSTFAGSGAPGYNGDNRSATSAQLHEPWAVAVDAAGNVYISDHLNHRVRLVQTGSLLITTVLGNGAASFNGDGASGPLTNIGQPGGLALVDGALLASDRANSRVRRLDLVSGVVTTLAGSGTPGFSGDGGPATDAALAQVSDIDVDTAGNVYLSDTANKRVRRVDTVSGVIETVAGNGWNAHCGDGGPALDACFHGTTSIAMDAAGDLYLGETWTGRVRKISLASGLVSTVFGVDYDVPFGGVGGPATEASLGGQVSAVAFDPAGNLHIAGADSNRVGRVDALTGTFSVLAGNGTRGFSGDGGPATLAQLNQPYHVVFDAAGNAYISDSGNHRIRKVEAGTGIITTFAGTGLTTGPLDPGPATTRTLSNPGSLVFDAAGNLVIADQGHCRIRIVIMATGIMDQIGGNGSCAQGPVNNPVNGNPVGNVLELARSPTTGEIYVATPGDIRKIDAWGWVRQVVNGGAPLDNPSGRPVADPYGMVFDSLGRLYLTTFVPDGVRRLSNLSWSPPDSTPPIVSGGWSGTPGSGGWWRYVHMGWSIVDEQSAIISFTGCVNDVITTDTAGLVRTCTATSHGGTASSSITVRRDATPPVITLGAVPAPNAAGWHTANVSIPFTVSDATSGVANVNATSPIVFAGDGVGYAATVTATDVAGNSSSAATPVVNIDGTPPQLTVTAPAAGATYGALSIVNAQYACGDATSGIATCDATLANGAPLPTDVAGAKSFSATATDLAGNVSTLGLSYSVAPLVFERFIEPLRRSPTFNGVTAGSLVPIRWRLLSAGQAVTNPAAFQSISVFNQACQGTPVPLNDTAIGGAGLSVNPANGYFTYNWQTEASWAGTCRRVQIRFSDNSVREVVFRIN